MTTGAFRPHATLTTARCPHPLLAGQHAHSARLLAGIDAFARSGVDVLITGETGVGKSLVAERLHLASGRTGTFVRHSLALRSTLAEDEFRGHVRGAFTDALTARAGLLEAAHLGTCFLDEIHRADPTHHGFFLDATERRPIMPLGGSRPITYDVKMVYATNLEPYQLKGVAGFPDDLIRRLPLAHIRIPPLRECREAIAPMAMYYLERHLAAFSRPFSAQISPDLEAVLARHSWPGNLRQFEAAMKLVALHLDADRPAEPSDLPDLDLYDRPESLATPSARRAHAAVQAAGGNKRQAARLLGISQTTLYKRLRLEATAVP